MIIAQALKWGETHLSKSSIATARLDALVLLEDATRTDRAKLLAEPDYAIKPKDFAIYQAQINKRAKQLPLAYVRNVTEFYGRSFYIDERVLEPRPESETMIEELLDLILVNKIANPIVADIGTGSGALAITLKLECPELNIYATDIDSACLVVAKRNAKRHNADISFLKGDLLAPMPVLLWSSPLLIMANLPYVPSEWKLNPPAMNEPAIAIFGGSDGLDIYRKIFSQLKMHTYKQPCYIFTESLPPQHEELSNIARSCGFSLVKVNDFIQVFSCSA